ncbi:glycosyltransferase family 2 protein [Micromonospora sp. NPDC005203]|uniref:glycosyltransferase family 2 protein n=1 Tax=Micromonospora sp. NPDC005203 TaxID=3364226 RepID=UPI0036862E29
MSNLISVITPVFGRSLEYLAEAYESLAAQVMPEGWHWEWLVQEDGQTGQVEAALPPDGRIKAGSGRRGGPGVARTVALARAKGSLVKVLDADDQLTEGALERDIRVLSEFPNVGWTVSRVLDLMPDGATRGFPGDPLAGPLARGAVFEYWTAHSYRASVHPATMCIRRSLVVALGGWMALPASEDTGLLMAADVTSAGYFISEPGLLYRKWQGQATSQAEHIEPGEWMARMSIIEGRARALQTLFP